MRHSPPYTLHVSQILMCMSCGKLLCSFTHDFVPILWRRKEMLRRKSTRKKICSVQFRTPCPWSWEGSGAFFWFTGHNNMMEFACVNLPLTPAPPVSNFGSSSRFRFMRKKLYMFFFLSAVPSLHLRSLIELRVNVYTLHFRLNQSYRSSLKLRLTLWILVISKWRGKWEFLIPSYENVQPW